MDLEAKEWVCAKCSPEDGLGGVGVRERRAREGISTILYLQPHPPVLEKNRRGRGWLQSQLELNVERD